MSESFETFDGGPTWSFDRFGMSRTPLPDGRVVCVAGEHEDSYDPDFNIYNDVVVFDPDGSWQIYLYPRDDFPPTDFHAAVLVGKDVYLLGSLGYMDERDGPLPVYCLHTNDWSIERVLTTGDAPPRLYKVFARLTDPNTIHLFGGEYAEGRERRPNVLAYALDLRTHRWSVIGPQPSPATPPFGNTVGDMDAVKSFARAWELIDVIARGVPFDHPLWGADLWPLYASTGDGLFAVSGMPFRYALCELMWGEPRGVNSTVRCRLFDSDAAVVNFRDDPTSYDRFGHPNY